MAWILFIGFMVLIMLRVPIVIAMGMAVLGAVVAGGGQARVLLIPPHISHIPPRMCEHRVR